MLLRHPLNLMRATRVGETQDGFSLVRARRRTASGSCQFLQLASQFLQLFRVKSGANVPDESKFFALIRPNSSEPKGRAEVRDSVQPLTTASTVLVTFSFTQYGLRSETYGLSARFADISLSCVLLPAFLDCSLRVQSA